MNKTLKITPLLVLLFLGCGEESSSTIERTQKNRELNITKELNVTKIKKDTNLVIKELVQNPEKELEVKTMITEEKIRAEIIEDDDSIPIKSEEELEDEALDISSEDENIEEDMEEDKEIEVMQKPANELLDEERIEAEES